MPATLAAIPLLGFAFLAFLDHAPNRLVVPTPVPLAALGLAPILLAVVPPVALLGLAIIGGPGARPLAGRGAEPRFLAVACANPVLLLAAMCLGAERLPGRVGIGAACWIGLLAALLAISHSLAPFRRLRAVVPVLLAAGFIAAATAGAFGRLSLAVEFSQRRAALADALWRHLELSIATLCLACAIGLPLGIASFRRPSLRGPLYGVLNVLQTIPSIAAFGLLIAPLSALAIAVPWLGRLGVGGIGAAPALIALTLYGLLPVVRNADAGLASVDPAIREAAAGMGLTPRGLLWAVELPLAMPALLAGVRIVAVQTIGLATVASLIGAGGLGTFVFEGVGEDATDLVLLGALPVTAMALLADAALRAAERRFRPG